MFGSLSHYTLNFFILMVRHVCIFANNTTKLAYVLRNGRLYIGTLIWQKTLTNIIQCVWVLQDLAVEDNICTLDLVYDIIHDGVLGAGVCVEVTLVLGAVGAVDTGIWFLSRVSSNMQLQVTLLSAAVRTELAGIGLLSRVCPLVYHDLLAGVKELRTVDAFVYSLCFMKHPSIAELPCWVI